MVTTNIKRHLIRLLILISALIIWSGCLPSNERLTRGRTVSQEWIDTDIYVQLEASTSCVALGETVTITATVKNDSQDPLILVGDPAIDLELEVIEQSQQRLSELQSLPKGEVILMPQEQMQYTMQWEMTQPPPAGHPQPSGSARLWLGYIDHISGGRWEPRVIDQLPFYVGRYQGLNINCKDIPVVVNKEG